MKTMAVALPYSALRRREELPDQMSNNSEDGALNRELRQDSENMKPRGLRLPQSRERSEGERESTMSPQRVGIRTASLSRWNGLV